MSEHHNPISPEHVEVLSTGEELLDRARSVARRIEGRVWAVIDGHESSGGHAGAVGDAPGLTRHTV